MKRAHHTAINTTYTYTITQTWDPEQDEDGIPYPTETQEQLDGLLFETMAMSWEGLSVHHRCAKSGITRDIHCPTEMPQEQYMVPDVVVTVDQDGDRTAVEPCNPKAAAFLDKYFRVFAG